MSDAVKAYYVVASSRIDKLVAPLLKDLLDQFDCLSPADLYQVLETVLLRQWERATRRSVTFIVYSDDEWTEGDGGELRLHERANPSVARVGSREQDLLYPNDLATSTFSRGRRRKYRTKETESIRFGHGNDLIFGIGVAAPGGRGAFGRHDQKDAVRQDPNAKGVKRLCSISGVSEESMGSEDFVKKDKELGVGLDTSAVAVNYGFESGDDPWEDAESDGSIGTGTLAVEQTKGGNASS